MKVTLPGMVQKSRIGELREEGPGDVPQWVGIDLEKVAYY